MIGIRNVAAILAAMLATSAAAQEAAEAGYIDTAPGVSIYFERYGSGSNVVLIPNRMFMPEMRRLARPDRSLILYDMRNRGRSRPVADVAQLTILGDVADVEAIRRHFRAEHVSLVGYSYLGLMVALYATGHPDRVERLVQIGSVPRRFGTPYPADQTADLSSLDADGRAAAAAWQAANAAATSETPQVDLCRIQHRFLSYLLVGNPANHQAVPDNCSLENEWPRNQTRHLGVHFADIRQRDFPREPFTRLTQPVLTFHGTLDRNAPYGGGLEWATTFRNGRLITVDGGAHQLWLDDPGIIAEIDQFLGGAWPARSRSFGRE